MNRSLLCALCLLLLTAGGCISTYVGDPEKSIADDKLVGVWHSGAKGDEQLWFVHALDQRSYLVQLVQFDAKENKPASAKEAVNFHAWLPVVGGQRFVSMKAFLPLHMIKPKDKDSANRYIVARLNPANGTLEARPADEKFIAAHNISPPAAFETALAAHLNEDATYGETTRLTRVDLANPGAAKAALEVLAP